MSPSCLAAFALSYLPVRPHRPACALWDRQAQASAALGMLGGGDGLPRERAARDALHTSRRAELLGVSFILCWVSLSWQTPYSETLFRHIDVPALAKANVKSDLPSKAKGGHGLGRLGQLRRLWWAAVNGGSHQIRLSSFPASPSHLYHSAPTYKLSMEMYNNPVNLDVTTIAKGPIRTKPAQDILSTSSFYEYFYG